MEFQFTVTVRVERQSGKFAARDEIADYLLDELRGSDPGEVSGVGADGDTEYTVTDFDVEEVAR